MGVAGRPQAAGGAETGGALAGSAGAGAGTASAAGASRSVTPSAISTATTTTAGAGNATHQHQAHAQQPAQAPQPSGRVEVKAPPFVCRGRQFVLHEPPMDEDQRQRIRSAIRNRMIGDALAKVRQHDEDYVRASRAKSVLATKALLERQELELAARLRNLEQQKDTLKLLLEQIEHEGDGDDAMEGDAVES